MRELYVVTFTMTLLICRFCCFLKSRKQKLDQTGLIDSDITWQSEFAFDASVFSAWYAGQISELIDGNNWLAYLKDEIVSHVDV